MKYCLVIPHYNHFYALLKLLPKLAKRSLPCIIVDDGSEDEGLSELQKIVIEHASSIHLICHDYNRGKGAAVISASYHARTLGYSHIIQLDADGQHDINDIDKFIAYSQLHPDTIVSGKPVFDESVPKVRLYGRKITDFWVAVETLSFQIKDALCGFRIYPLKSFELLLDNYRIGSRMDFDTEVLVKAVWSSIPLYFIDSKVIYPKGGVSHFKYWRDNKLLIGLHSRLMIGMLLRSPKLSYQRLMSLLKKL
ncbi:MAG: glycosyltransferase family 2 protein, partial [Gammaproteobacteria bacterium]|nr:glycosyltransferase family 2 protein [Gammaproteobacteria bacterium]